MKWVTKHNISILDIDYDTKSCLIEYHGRTYGCPMRQHSGEWYFSFNDRCIWYLVKRGDKE